MENTEIVSLAVLALLSIVEVSPIKINPWSWIGKTIGRAINGELISKVNDIEIQMQRMKNTIDENEAKAARVRILRFGDELYQGKKHSKEHFDNILADITDYDDYCRAHVDFKNERTKITEQIIKERYHQCCVDKSFLERGTDV